MRCLVAATAFLAALLVAPAALAHESGKAEPRISAAVTGAAGLERTVVVRLADIDSGRPVTGAAVTVTATMSEPHFMRTLPWSLPERSPGLYSAPVRFVMPARWTLAIRASGAGMVAASSTLTVDVVPAAAPAGAASAPAPLPTRLDTSVTGRDVLAMVVLWIHALAAAGWILGVLLMVLAVSTPIAASGVRAGLAGWYRRRGAWPHWGLVAVVVGTGVYNMLRVAPFRLSFAGAGLDRVASIPYGRLYEAILVVKLGLFAALLVTGSRLLARTLRAGAPVAEKPAGFWRTLVRGLGPSGLLYLAAVPLVLGAAAALRYVHILSHVAEAVASG
jgi:hypothetical protein